MQAWPVVLGLVWIAACTAAAAPSSPAADAQAPAPSASIARMIDPTPPSPTPAPCPSDMVMVEGEYCPTPVQTCKRWLDPPGPYEFYRCAEYMAPSVCKGSRVKERFCIDREEYVAPGETLPLANQSWSSAKETCEGLGKRLCLESEWQFACEGDEMRPYPYGFVRDATLCNIDRVDLGKPNGGLKDLREPIADRPKCLSPFGVHGMSGNVEEWSTIDEGKAPQRSSMKGAWWLPGKNTCRSRTVGHGEIYRGKQVGVRCCRDAG